VDGHATASVQGYRAGLSGSRPKRSLMPMDTMPPALNLAFCTALLLTGDMKTAEAAVMHGIEACEDLPPRGLLIEAVTSAIQRRTTSADGPYELECLPRELQRLLCCSHYRGTALCFECWWASLPNSARNFSTFPFPSSRVRYMEGSSSFCSSVLQRANRWGTDHRLQRWPAR